LAGLKKSGLARSLSLGSGFPEMPAGPGITLQWLSSNFFTLFQMLS
jgi:hypothetical protein